VALARIFFVAQFPTVLRSLPFRGKLFAAVFANKTKVFMDRFALGIGIAGASATRADWLEPMRGSNNTKP
jgi:hypothetical protein